MKPSKQCTAASNKANRVLGLINRTLTYKNKTNVKNLYEALACPHLEYAVQAWAPSLKIDINRIEGVQRRPLKLIPALRNKQRTLSYLCIFSSFYLALNLILPGGE